MPNNKQNNQSDPGQQQLNEQSQGQSGGYGNTSQDAVSNQKSEERDKGERSEIKKETDESNSSS